MMLDLLTSRASSAAANMATDFLSLQHYPQVDHARFRHYGWQQTACTFGFGQKIAWVREQLAGNPPDQICRRPTGGGIVDHRDDWTYSLVIPRGHDLYDARAVTSYEAIHRALVASLQTQSCDATIKEYCEPDPDCPGNAAPAVCFDRAELFDVVHASSGAKIAGAAQKRAKRGLLFQGSIWRPTVGEIDWDEFEQTFVEKLGALLQTEPTPTPWPEAWDEAIDQLAESYSTPEWIERR
jgi:lipoate-protein ligase A